MVKKALLVGINKYPKADDRLLGCVNDVLAMQGVLTEIFQYATSDLKILLDRDATKQNIVNGLKWLAEGGAEAAVRVFHYAGHGHSLPDDNEEDEDGTDEALVPYDYEQKRNIIDDELKVIYKSFPAASNLTLIMDCCHSGSIQRRSTKKKATYRFVPNTHKERLAIAAARKKFREKRRQEAFAKVLASSRGRSVSDEEIKQRVFAEWQKYEKQPFGGNYNLREGNILLAACRSTELATDAKIGRKNHGAFTYYLTENLRKTRGKIVYADLIKKTGQAMHDHGFDDQVPQLECDPGKEKAKMLAVF